MPEFADLNEVLARAEQAGVKKIINVAYDLDAARKALTLAQNSGSVEMFATVGIHPHDAGKVKEADYRQIEKLLDNPKVVAVGEIGLDYFKNISEPKDQVELFVRQLRIAKARNLPVVIHDRDAHRDTLRIIREELGVGWKLVFHCFSGDREFAKEVLDLGAYIGIDGPVTFKTAEELRAVVAWAPLERILLETDCPYLAPDPYRGKRNEPSYVVNIARKVADIKKVPLEQVEAVTTLSACQLFGF
jgi:TatD DNase family protein